MAQADVEKLLEVFGKDVIVETSDFRGDETVRVTADRVHDVLAWCKDEGGYEMCVDVCGVDYPERAERLEVVYHLHSLRGRKRLRVKTRVSATQGKNVVPTATDLWRGADWFERECWDLIGVRFEGHPNLKRILTYPEFEGHPLRRDYPIDRRQARTAKRPNPPEEGQSTGERLAEEAGRAHHSRAPMGISKR